MKKPFSSQQLRTTSSPFLRRFPTHLDNDSMILRISDNTKKLTSQQRRRQALKYSYLKRAVERFLEDTKCRTPEEAVSKGLRTLEDWTLILFEELELHRLQHTQEKQRISRREAAGQLAPV
jgi:hypothetical protein